LNDEKIAKLLGIHPEVLKEVRERVRLRREILRKYPPPKPLKVVKIKKCSICASWLWHNLCINEDCPKGVETWRILNQLEKIKSSINRE